VRALRAVVVRAFRPAVVHHRCTRLRRRDTRARPALLSSIHVPRQVCARGDRRTALPFSRKPKAPADWRGRNAASSQVYGPAGEPVVPDNVRIRFALVPQPTAPRSRRSRSLTTSRRSSTYEELAAMVHAREARGASSRPPEAGRWMPNMISVAAHSRRIERTSASNHASDSAAGARV
jgi:hypothetical protein